MKAYELLNSEDKWTQHSYAVDELGCDCQSSLKEAVKWCAIGALRKCYNYDPNFYNSDYEEVYMKLFHSIKNTNITRWNDSNPYQTVYNKLKELDI